MNKTCYDNLKLLGFLRKYLERVCAPTS